MHCGIITYEYEYVDVDGEESAFYVLMHSIAAHYNLQNTGRPFAFAKKPTFHINVLLDFK
jgi:hypothetical protein